MINGYSEHKELADRFAAYLSEEYADGLYERSGKMPASIHAAENADNGALTIFANEYADSVSLPKMLETGNFWMQLQGVERRGCDDTGAAAGGQYVAAIRKYRELTKQE